MIQPSSPAHLVAIIGAGPAGLFAARELASNGVRVALFNRDIKPGGLAEYGIFPSKYRIRQALQGQFRQILADPCLMYYGNVTIGHNGELTLDDLRRLGFQAILVTVGAQGTKWLGLPGEHLQGVYHAKDIVFHYNQLPPYSQQPVHIGRRVAVVGMGNVMLDITHWLLQDTNAQEITAIARRGPAEVKFSHKEMQPVIASLDIDALDAEIERVAPMMRAVGEDPAAAREQILASLPHAEPAVRPQARFRLHFLASPVRLLGDEQGMVRALELEDTILALVDGHITARGLKQRHLFEADTVIFAIGDTVDETLGLPMQGSEYARHPQPRFPVEGISYEVYDPVTEQPVTGVFVAGWARQASKGLVGLARRDGANAARSVLQYLKSLPSADESIPGVLQRSLMQLSQPVVTRADLARLEQIEAEEAARRSLPSYKFSTNEEMLRAMGLKEI